jgi:methylated-DNA-[protein]-cysteine S-methyltransferase
MMTDACTLTAQHTVVATPIGDLTVVREGHSLTGLYFPHHWYKPDPVTFGPRNDRGFEGVAGQLGEYPAGTRTLFTLPLKPPGHGVPAPCLGADRAGSLRADHHLRRPRPPSWRP